MLWIYSLFQACLSLYSLPVCVCSLCSVVSDLSADGCAVSVAEAQPNPAVLTSFHPGPHQRQADRAGRDVWRGQSEIQRALCGVLPVPWPALAPGVLHWPARGAAGDLHCQHWPAQQVLTALGFSHGSIAGVIPHLLLAHPFHPLSCSGDHAGISENISVGTLRFSDLHREKWELHLFYSLFYNCFAYKPYLEEHLMCCSAVWWHCSNSTESRHTVFLVSSSKR